MFMTQAKPMDRLPPLSDADALLQHIKRCAFQVRHVWAQSTLNEPGVPDLYHWGWVRGDDGLFEIEWMTPPVYPVVDRLSRPSRSSYGQVESIESTTSSIDLKSRRSPSLQVESIAENQQPRFSSAVLWSIFIVQSSVGV